MNTRSKWTKFSCVALLIVMTGCLTPPRPHSTVDVGDLVGYELISSKFVFINFGPADKKRIRKEMKPLLKPACSAAFRDANLRAPLQVVIESGVVFRPSADLYNYSASELGLTHEQIRKTYAMEFSSGRAQAGTISPVLYGVRLTVDGRPRIFLHDTAFLGKSFWFGRLSLHEILVHEFIHAGGQPPTPGWFFQHDLAGFEAYDKILKACK